MNEQRIYFVICYAIALASVYFLKAITVKTANKAIDQKKLCTGIYSLFPIEGDQAVRLAKGYILGIKIVFWFVVILFPLLFVHAVVNKLI